MQKKNPKLYIGGINVAKEVLIHQAEQIQEVLIADNKKNPETDDLAHIARKAGLVVKTIPEKKLKEYIGTVKHQGIVLKMQAFKYADLDELLATLNKGENPLLVMLEQIEDPHNVGAIIRTATALGASGLIMLNHNQAPINATSFKTSAGTAGRLPICRVSNLSQTAEKLKKAGFWIVGMDASGENIHKTQAMADSPVVVAMGNEGEGLRSSTKSFCDFLVNIPMTNQVESLNVSVSAGIAIYEWQRLSQQK